MIFFVKGGCYNIYRIADAAKGGENMKYESRKLTPFRLLSIYAYEALEAGHNMYAQIELDVTGIRQKLRDQRREGRNISFFGALLSAIAKTIDENKEFNHIRCGKRIFCFDEVDIYTAIEMMHNGTLVPRICVVRDAGPKGHGGNNARN